MAAEERRFVISHSPENTRPGFLDAWIWRLDGMPSHNRFGEKLRTDRDDWLTEDEAIEMLREMLRAIPRRA